MQLYDIIDLQTGEDDWCYFNRTWQEVKEIVYEKMKDRSEGEQDELAEEYRERIKNGVDGISDDVVLEELKFWDYKVIMKNVIGK